MAKVRILPDSVANKIAAGEVVERPASVLKELLENSLDAGARRIDIQIESGGKRLIRVVDDGEGMARDDAITAFERHATSKLRSADELDAIATLGFRGEALPSMASVSRLTLRTKTASDLEGSEVEFSGGKLVAVRDIAWPGGTEVEVKDLFFNIPARRKFLKSDSTEAFHITSIVQHYALANPELSFLLIRDGRQVIEVAPAATLRDRAYQLLGHPMLEKLMEVDYEADGLRVTGFTSNPQEQRSSRDAQFFFVNRRFVRDHLIARAVSEAYRSMMPSGTYPAAVLFVDLPPAEVDVNVHPAKTEVRFMREGAVMMAIREAITRALAASHEPVTRLRQPAPSSESDWGKAPDRAARASSPERGTAPSEFGFSLQPPPDVPSLSEQPPLRIPFLSEDVAELESHSFSSSPSAEQASAEASIERCSPVPAQPPEQISISAERTPPAIPLPGLGHGIKPLGQIRDSYIVATDEEGLILIDQHVAHERVLFEQFRDDRKSRSPEVQQLLIPQTLDLTPAESEAFEIVQAELQAIGIETTQLSGRTIAVNTAPAGLGAGDLVSLVREVLGVVERERRGFSLDHIREQIAASLACKAAIKINMPLTPEKMQWLIDELMNTRNPMTCPHGRPIIMRFGLRDIERGFKRPV